MWFIEAENNKLVQKTILFDQIIRSKNAFIWGEVVGSQFAYQMLIYRYPKNIKGFIISERKNNQPYYLFGKKVYTFGDLDKLNSDRSEYVIISNNYSPERIDYLRENGFRQILHSPNIISAELDEKNLAYCKTFFLTVDENLFNKGNDLNPIDKKKVEDNVYIYEVISKNRYHQLNEDNINSKPGYVHSIEGGASLNFSKESIAEITDDTGDNVSVENAAINEQTAAYWIAHNDNNHPYVGMFQYSRGLKIGYSELYDSMKRDVDLIVGLPWITKQPLIYRTDDILYDAICSNFSDYKIAAEEYFLNRIFFKSNLVIAKNYIYKDYVNFIFSVLRYVEQNYQIDYFSRQLGYLAEHLTNIYLFRHRKDMLYYFVPEIEYFH